MVNHGVDDIEKVKCWRCGSWDYEPMMYPVYFGSSFSNMKTANLCEVCFEEVGALPPPQEEEDVEGTELEPEEIQEELEEVER